MNYDELERIDKKLATECPESAGEHRLSVPENIESSIVINGSMDNFENEKSTQSRIGCSYETI